MYIQAFVHTMYYAEHTSIYTHKSIECMGLCFYNAFAEHTYMNVHTVHTM